MRRIRTALVAALMLVAVGAGQAAAAQTQMNMYVVAYHFNLQQDLFAAYAAPCTGNACSVTIAVSSRDYGMVSKQCGSTTVTFQIAYPAAGSGVSCPGNGNWKIDLFGHLLDANGDFIQAETYVDVTITVVKGGKSLL